MSKSQTLRALVNERLTAAAEEIFALFERTIAEYEEEVCRSKEENQRKQELLDSILSPSKSPGPGLNQDPPHTPRIKEEPQEPEEPSVKQYRIVQTKQGEDISAETHLHSSHTDDEDWRAPPRCSATQMETDVDGDHDNQLQKGHRLTALVKEIFALFERTIVEYEEEVCRSKEENQRKQELLDSILSPSKSPDPGLNQHPPHTAQIKEEPEEPKEPKEPEEPSVKQKDRIVQVSMGVPEFSAVCVKTEESSLLDTDDDENWRARFSCSDAQIETDADGDHDNQVQKGQTLRASVNDRLSVTAEETRLNQDSPQTSQIKEEPEEPSVTQEVQVGDVSKQTKMVNLHDNNNLLEL
ncbi:hypothetical protein NL108_004148 [Boleophthalmus pectinirostris]|nr:hypothetical protein NL108_004148 [Boleophthalmus pectinirostris]